MPMALLVGFFVIKCVEFEKTSFEAMSKNDMKKQSGIEFVLRFQDYLYQNFYIS